MTLPSPVTLMMMPERIAILMGVTRECLPPGHLNALCAQLHARDDDRKQDQRVPQIQQCEVIEIILAKKQDKQCKSHLSPLDCGTQIRKQFFFKYLNTASHA